MVLVRFSSFLSLVRTISRTMSGSAMRMSYFDFTLYHFWFIHLVRTQNFLIKSLSVLSLWKLRMETELKRVGSIVDRIQVFILLAKEKVRSAVALDAGLTAKILQILQTLNRNFFFGFSSLIYFRISWKCSICLSSIKTLNVASSTFKSLIFTSVAYFSRAIFISADVSSPFNVLVSRDSKFSNTKNGGWSKRSRTEDIKTSMAW